MHGSVKMNEEAKADFSGPQPPYVEGEIACPHKLRIVPDRRGTHDVAARCGFRISLIKWEKLIVIYFRRAMAIVLSFMLMAGIPGLEVFAEAFSLTVSYVDANGAAQTPKSCQPMVATMANGWCAVTENAQTGATVIAISDGYGAAIGGGSEGESGTITISRGNVTATSGDSGAGIGSGYRADRNDITITGNVTVTATSGKNGAGIGAGWCVWVFSSLSGAGCRKNDETRS